MGRLLMFLAALGVGLATACDFETDAPAPTKKAAKEFYDRLPEEPRHAPSSPTS